MSDILECGLSNIDDLSNPDLITFPPSGEDRDTNHMDVISQNIENSNSEIVDITEKIEDYPSQKSVDNMEQRIENVSGKIKISEQSMQEIDFSEVDTAVVLDDVVVTGSTMSNTAQALKSAGTNRVYGLGISRNCSLIHLTDHTDLLHREA